MTRMDQDYKDKSALNIHTVKKIDRIRLGSFNVEFFHVNHTIPDAVGLAINSPIGTVIHTGDFKFDHSPISDAPADVAKIARLGSENILALMSDSTDSRTPGYSLSESKIAKTLDEIFEHNNSRLIIATFAALISRIQSVITAAEKHGRKVAVDGYSMKTNVEIARTLGHLQAKKGTLIPISKVNEFPDSKPTRQAARPAPPVRGDPGLLPEVLAPQRPQGLVDRPARRRRQPERGPRPARARPPRRYRPARVVGLLDAPLFFAENEPVTPPERPPGAGVG